MIFESSPKVSRPRGGTLFLCTFGMVMTVADVERVIEEWAPKWIAWDRDNVGLQIGNKDHRVSRILVALELTGKVVSEAVRKRVDLIITHHPPFFHPVSSITDADQLGSDILLLARNGIAVYSAHTNLDFAKDGVSFVLAEKLGLTHPEFLSPLEGNLAKVVVFVPGTHVDQVAQAMSSSGAGNIGEYGSCSFRVEGTGTFRGSEKSKPYAGTRGLLERTNEVRLEMVVPKGALESTIKGIKKVHPYEEVAYDVYPLQNRDANFGMGVIGRLRTAVRLETFLKHAKKVLHTSVLKYCGKKEQMIQTIAVCGGSGSELLEDAVRRGADAFLTADVRYHTFHSALGKIALVDAGHFETEIGILEALTRRLQTSFSRSKYKVSIITTQYSTNPVCCI